MTVNDCPIKINGSSTGRPPIHVKIAHEAIKVQNRNCLIGQNAIPRLLLLDVRGSKNRIRSAANRAITPPNLLGIDRRIAYTHRKYHSGLMWIGVTSGLASRKFSGSVSKLGVNKIRSMNRDKAIENPSISLIE